jgi:hypothetical protein
MSFLLWEITSEFEIPSSNAHVSCRGLEIYNNTLQFSLIDGEIGGQKL